ncbi:MAG: LytR/AlgR family response regulator transcription factor [Flavobacteriales bacterium]
MTDPLRILIVEDDAIIGESIHMHLTNLGHSPYPPVDNEADAKAAMATQEVDLAFLDIRLHEGDSGIELAKHIDGANLCPYIFLTAYTDDRTLAEVGNTRPSGFIVKPFRKNDMKAAISIASLNRMLQDPSERESTLPDSALQEVNDHVFINVGGNWERVDIADILYLVSAHVYTEIHTVHGKKITRRPLSQLVEELDPAGILRIHRSMAVNLRRIDGFDSHSVRIGSEEFAISNSYKKQVKERMRSI